MSAGGLVATLQSLGALGIASSSGLFLGLIGVGAVTAAATVGGVVYGVRKFKNKESTIHDDVNPNRLQRLRESAQAQQLFGWGADMCLLNDFSCAVHRTIMLHVNHHTNHLLHPPHCTLHLTNHACLRMCTMGAGSYVH